MLLALVALMLVPAPAAGSAAKPDGSDRYGLLAAGANGITGTTTAELTANFRRLRDAGVRAIRMDINWLGIEPEGEPLHDYDFSETDRQVTAIRRAGLKVIGILDYGHPDYSTLGGATPIGGGLPPFGVASAGAFPPDDPADFADFAAAAAQHFGGDVIAWEVWNEENQGYRFWPPHEDPAAYERLLCEAYPVLKAIDPDTPVIFGGMFFAGVADLPGMSAPNYLEAAYDANPNLGACYDAMAYHPYAYPFTAPELDVPVRGSVLSAADQMQAILDDHGDGGKALWITEVGWPTHDRAYGVPEAKQAQYVARMSAATFAQDVPVLGWYTYGDYPDPSGGFNQESWFGFFHADGSPKPAVKALDTFARVFRDARFVRDRSEELGLPPGELNNGGRGFALRYVREHRGRRTRITALWLACEGATDGQNQGQPSCGGGGAPSSLPLALRVRHATARVVDYLGEHRRARERDGALQLEIGPGPMYVLDDLRGRL